MGIPIWVQFYFFQVQYIKNALKREAGQSEIILFVINNSKIITSGCWQPVNLLLTVDDSSICIG